MTAPHRGPGRRFPAWEAAAALAAVALFARTVGFDWVYDDQMEVARNAFVTSLAHVPRMFASTVWAGSGMETYLYRPLALVTYAFNYQLSGTSPWSYHLTNVLLHAGVSVLVVRVGLRWGLSTLAAGAAGLLFAVHPVHVEAVAPVFGRKDLLATLFVLSMALTHHRATQRGGWRLAAAPLLYLAAMLSKEVGIVGVALVAAQDAWLHRDLRGYLARRHVPVAYASYLLAAAAFLAARTTVTGGLAIPDTSTFDNPLVGAPLVTRLATAWMVAGKGVVLHVLPVTQSPDYSFNAIPLAQGFGDPRTLLAAAFTLVGAGVLALRSVRGSVAPLAAAWYGVALLPVANVLLITGTLFAERLLYLPSVAFCLAAGAGVGWVSRAHPRVAWGGIVVAVAAFSALTWRYTSAWTDDVTLFQAAVAAVPASTKAQHKLGEELLRRGEVEGALAALNRAMEVAPDNAYAAETLAQARNTVAQRYLEGARGGGPLPDGPETLYALGAAAQESGDPTLAIRAVEAAVARDPTLARGWLALSILRRNRGDGSGADQALRRFLDTEGGRYPEQARQARALLTGSGG